MSYQSIELHSHTEEMLDSAHVDYDPFRAYLYLHSIDLPEMPDLDEEDTTYQDQYDEAESDLESAVSEAIRDFEDAYQGSYPSDSYFAESMADELGLLSRDLSWPLNYIDWEQAARELMYDYSEEDGYYFRD